MRVAAALLALLFGGCSGSDHTAVPIASPPPVRVAPPVAAVPTVYAAPPRGVPLAHLVDSDVQFDQSPDAPNFYPAGGVLAIDSTDPRNSGCSDTGQSPDDIDTDDPGGPLAGTTCNGDHTRCTDDRHALILHAGVDGPWLYAKILYPQGAVPTTDPERVATVLSRRDRVCELYEMQRTGQARVDPHGYAMQSYGDDDELHWDFRCGEAAVAAARADLREGRFAWCMQTVCSRLGGNDGTSISAHRDANGTLLLFTSSSAPTGTGATDDEAWRRLLHHGCP